MAFFKFRKGGDKSPDKRQPAESIEAMRKRARHRLIGAGVLVLVGVIGFPLLFDTQPRPIDVDIPIEIPDRDKVQPLAVPAPRPAQPPAVSGPVTVAPAAPTPAASETAAAAPKAPASAATETALAKPEAKTQTAPEPKTQPAPEAKLQPQPGTKAAAKDTAGGDGGARAQALLEGKPVQVAAAPSANGRYVVQVGAFADPAKARAARLKVERAGLKTYTHVAETKDGKRVRVRVGPFATRAEADKAASKIKGLQLPAAILTL